jgi:hypothetical protein
MEEEGGREREIGEGAGKERRRGGGEVVAYIYRTQDHKW